MLCFVLQKTRGHRSKSLVFSIHAPLAATAVVLEFLLAFVFRPGEEQLGNVRGRHLMTLSCLVSAKQSYRENGVHERSEIYHYFLFPRPPKKSLSFFSDGEISLQHRKKSWLSPRWLNHLSKDSIWHGSRQKMNLLGEGENMFFHIRRRDLIYYEHHALPTNECKIVTSCQMAPFIIEVSSLASLLCQYNIQYLHCQNLVVSHCQILSQ